MDHQQTYKIASGCVNPVIPGYIDFPKGLKKRVIFKANSGDKRSTVENVQKTLCNYCRDCGAPIYLMVSDRALMNGKTERWKYRIHK